MNSFELQKHVGYRQEIKKTFLIPAAASGIMGLIAYGVYTLCFTLTQNNIVSIAFSILIAIFAYGVILLLLKGLSEEEIYRFPKGHAIIALAKKFRLL